MHDTQSSHLQYKEKLEKNLRITKLYVVPLTLILLGLVGMLGASIALITSSVSKGVF